jgi:hypothetical protein
METSLSYRNRSSLRSTCFANQWPHEHWHQQISDPTLADAVLDQFIHNANRLKLLGQLYGSVCIVLQDPKSIRTRCQILCFFILMKTMCFSYRRI